MQRGSHCQRDRNRTQQQRHACRPGEFGRLVDFGGGRRQHVPVTDSDGAVQIERGGSPAAQIIGVIADKLGAKASVSAVYGAPIERDGVTVIPVARVSMGFGAGAGRQQQAAQAGDGGGGGGGAAAVPLGYIEIKDGVVTFRRILHPVVDVAVPLAVAMLGSVAPSLLRSLFTSRRRAGRQRG